MQPAARYLWAWVMSTVALLVAVVAAVPVFVTCSV